MGLIPIATMLAAPGALAQPCRLEARLEPERAFVGQQVVHIHEIVRAPEVASVEWLRAPGHPDLPSKPLGDTADHALSAEQAARFGLAEGHRRIVSRVFWPLRAGTVTLPEAVLACIGEDGERLAELVSPPLPLQVRPLPARADGRDVPVVVGILKIKTASPTLDGEVGQAIRWRIEVRGDGDLSELWRPSFESFSSAAAELGIDVFALPVRGRSLSGDRLTRIRTLEVDLVPRRAGEFVLPDVVLHRFDPQGERYEEVRAAGPHLRVIERSAAGRGGAPVDDRASRPPADEAGGAARGFGERSVLGPTAAVLGLCAVLLGWPFVQRWRRRRGGAEEALARAARAGQRGDRAAQFAALERALRHVASRKQRGAGEWPIDRLRAEGSAALAGIADALEDLEAARWGDPPRAPDQDGVGELVRALR